MTHRRNRLAALASSALLLALSGCSDNGNKQAQDPVPPTTTPTASATPSASPSATPTTSANAPLKCPELMDVITATDSVLEKVTAASDMVCAWSNNNSAATGSIQSEDWFRSKSLRSYRATMMKAQHATTGIRTKVVDRPDFGPGAFLVTLSGGPTGPITNLVVPRKGGQFASISVSDIDKDTEKLATDVDLTESLARAFIAANS